MDDRATQVRIHAERAKQLLDLAEMNQGIMDGIEGIDKATIDQVNPKDLPPETPREYFEKVIAFMSARVRRDKAIIDIRPEIAGLAALYSRDTPIEAMLNDA